MFGGDFRRFCGRCLRGQNAPSLGASPCLRDTPLVLLARFQTTSSGVAKGPQRAGQSIYKHLAGRLTAQGLLGGSCRATGGMCTGPYSIHSISSIPECLPTSEQLHESIWRPTHPLWHWHPTQMHSIWSYNTDSVDMEATDQPKTLGTLASLHLHSIEP